MADLHVAVVLQLLEFNESLLLVGDVFLHTRPGQCERKLNQDEFVDVGLTNWNLDSLNILICDVVVDCLNELVVIERGKQPFTYRRLPSNG